MVEAVAKKRRNKPSPAKESLLTVGTALLAVNPGASLIEIAQYAGVGRASLHRHFKSREALILAITDRALDELTALMKDSLDSTLAAKEQLLALVAALVPVGDRLHFLMNEWSSYEDSELFDKFKWQENLLVELIQTARSDGDIPAHLSDRWVYYVIDSMIFTAWYGVQDGTVKAENAADLASSVLTNGILK